MLGQVLTVCGQYLESIFELQIYFSTECTAAHDESSCQSRSTTQNKLDARLDELLLEVHISIASELRA